MVANLKRLKTAALKASRRSHLRLIAEEASLSLMRRAGTKDFGDSHPVQEELTSLETHRKRAFSW